MDPATGEGRGRRSALFTPDAASSPAWVANNGLTPAGRSVVQRLARAAEDGLNLGGFAPRLASAGALSVDAQAKAEIAVAAAIVIYAEQASGSRVPPWRISKLIADDRTLPDPDAALAEVATAPDPGARLADFNPPQKGYRELRDALNRLSESGAGAAQSDGDLDRETDLLASSDDKSAAKIARPRIKRLVQRRLAASSTNESKHDRSELLANMEMWRWEPRDMGERRDRG